jgi:hypothetical protein
MGLRQKLNESKPLSIGLAVLLAVLAGGLIYYETRTVPLMDINHLWYTDDEGKTWFLDTAYRVAPFDHNGKQAYIAHMFKSEKGAIWCAFIERYTADSQKKFQAALDEAAKNGKPPESVSREDFLTEVRKPNTTEWVLGTDFANSPKVMGTSSPDGSAFDNLRP